MSRHYLLNNPWFYWKLKAQGSTVYNEYLSILLLFSAVYVFNKGTRSVDVLHTHGKVYKTYPDNSIISGLRD